MTTQQQNPRGRGFSIEPANLRDITYVAANMRISDLKELSCQVPENWTASHIGGFCLEASNGLAFIGKYNGQPVVAFGLSPITPNYKVMSAWMFGVNRMERFLPLVAMFWATKIIPQCIESGMTRIEARSLNEDDTISSFFRSMGARQVDVLEDFGGLGVDFTLYTWFVSDFKQNDRIFDRFYRTERRHPLVLEDGVWYFNSALQGTDKNVFIHPEATGPAAYSENANTH
jgi:hypothetical protein